MVLAVGNAPVGAVTANAQRFRSTHFVVVGGSSARHNVAAVNNSPDAVAGAISRAVHGT